ncbi:MAG TPA: HAMP domain-containing sensor histidine kinase [Coprothermobacter proteolyticus]|nr:HAMP domain-containing sensor histidine kinase [Coprothermobacter proteolyticus]
MFTSRDIQILERLGMAAFVIDSDNVVLATKQISELPFFSFVPDAPMSVNVRRTDIREALLTRDSFAIMSPTRERNFQVDRFTEENTLIVVRETTSKVEQTEQVNILIYHVVHEIRNALNNLSLSLDYLNEPYMSKVEESIDRLDRLSQQLTDFASLSQLEPEDVHLDEVAKYIKGIFDVPVIMQREGTWRVNKKLLLMAIKNLLDNAVAYGEDPVVFIDEHQISVEDHGPGLPPQVLDRLFTPFNTTKSVGLGLFIAKKACELNNLTLDYKPNVPHGAIFTISLPIVPRM